MREIGALKKLKGRDGAEHQTILQSVHILATKCENLFYFI